MINLLALAIMCDDAVYYVRPSFPENVDCPVSGYECDILNNFGTDIDDWELPENNTVKMFLMEGYHTTDSNVYNFGCPVNPDTLHFIGNGNDTASVKVCNIDTAVTVKNTV